MSVLPLPPALLEEYEEEVEGMETILSLLSSNISNEAIRNRQHAGTHCHMSTYITSSRERESAVS